MVLLLSGVTTISPLPKIFGSSVTLNCEKVTNCESPTIISKEILGKVQFDIDASIEFPNSLVDYRLVKPNIDGSGCSVDIPEITQDGINAAVVAYYMDESEFLKNIPEWNPDLPDPEDDATTTMLKGVAVGSIGLLSLINNNEHLLNTDDNEDDNEDDNDDDNDDDTASDTAEKEFNEKIRLEKRSELIDLIKIGRAHV